jgi:hypothetical protein
MSESEHIWGLDPSQGEISVSAEATERLFSDAMMQIGDYDSRSDQMYAKFLDIPDLVLRETMITLQLKLETEGRSTRHFTDGFIIGYKLHAIEAELAGYEPPKLLHEAADDFFTMNGVMWGSKLGEHYFDDRMIALKDENEAYIDILEQAIPENENWSLEERDSFMLGGIVAHDLLVLQGYHVASIEAQIDSEIEESALYPEELIEMASGDLLVPKDVEMKLAESLIGAYMREAEDINLPE